MPRNCGTIDGLERVRFTSPHPAAFTDDVIAAMAETPNVLATTILRGELRHRTVDHMAAIDGLRLTALTTGDHAGGQRDVAARLLAALTS